MTRRIRSRFCRPMLIFVPVKNRTTHRLHCFVTVYEDGFQHDSPTQHRVHLPVRFLSQPPKLGRRFQVPACSQSVLRERGVNGVHSDWSWRVRMEAHLFYGQNCHHQSFFARERDLNGCMDQLWFSASGVWRLLVGGGDFNCIAWGFLGVNIEMIETEMNLIFCSFSNPFLFKQLEFFADTFFNQTVNFYEKDGDADFQT